MNKKKYFIPKVQQLMEISASELQGLINEHRKHINLEFVEDESGNNVAYIDSASLKKLIFFKQLKCGANLTIKEACEQMKVRKPIEGKQEKVEGMITAMEKEVGMLNEKIQTLTWNLADINAFFQFVMTALLGFAIFYMALKLWQKNLITIGEFIMYEGYFWAINGQIFSFGKISCTLVLAVFSINAIIAGVANTSNKPEP